MVPYSESYIILHLAIAAGVRVVHEPAGRQLARFVQFEREVNYKSKGDRKMHEGTLTTLGVEAISSQGIPAPSRSAGSTVSLAFPSLETVAGLSQASLPLLANPIIPFGMLACSRNSRLIEDILLIICRVRGV